MLPRFPEFKKLELSDQKDVEAITSKYPPYSDFDFATMWSWNINEKLEISLIGNTIIIFYEDVFDGQLKVSYLGDSKIRAVLQNLFGLLDDMLAVNREINLVPEISLRSIDFTKYFIEIDLKCCDYILDLQQLSTYAGSGFIKKRGKVNNFLRNYADTKTVILNLQNSHDQQEVLELNKLWLSNKAKYNVHLGIEQEKAALERFLKADFDNTLCVGLYREKLIGYSIYSFAHDNYAISHFTKADVFYKGIYEYLMKESASQLVKLGYRFLNYQEDMGIPELRVTKNSFNPIKILRKYIIKPL